MLYQPVSLHNSGQWDLTNSSGDIYRIQVSWPLKWDIDTARDSKLNVIYLVDGNAFFLSATESVRRHNPLHYSRRDDSQPTIVVGIGYPMTENLFSLRRAYDLTPPCDTYEQFIGRDGKPQTTEYGGAEKFLDFISTTLRPFLLEHVFPGSQFNREALFGHSYGGLLALHAMFKREKLGLTFDTYMAASPSIWWNKRAMYEIAQRTVQNRGKLEEEGQQCNLILSCGEYEEAPVQKRAEQDSEFIDREKGDIERGMRRNMLEMQSLLKKNCARISIKTKEFADEEHGTVGVCSLNWSIYYWLEQLV